MDTLALNIQDLCVTFGTGERGVKAVDGTSLQIKKGSVHALIGESGCGKSLTALSILRLLPFPIARLSAKKLQLGETDLLALSEKEMRSVRRNRVSMIFQEPMTSLNPVLTIHSQLQESLPISKELSKQQQRSALIQVLDEVGLPDPQKILTQFPHELSGGMKQRVMIAMALLGEPELLIADEPTTALDVTIQAQILTLLRQLQQARSMSMLFITHDLGIASTLADEISVMYSGHVVEHAPTRSFFVAPLHPYSERLIGSVPNIAKRLTSLTIIQGQVPDPRHRGPGCRFASRCSFQHAECLEGEIPMYHPHDMSPDSAAVRCILYASQRRPERSRTVVVEGVQSEQLIEQSTISSALLEVRELSVQYPLRKKHLFASQQYFDAVRGVSFDLHTGETLALVGESGCGKTSVALALARLIASSAKSLLIDGQDLYTMPEPDLRKSVQCVFQDPYNSMNPRLTTAEIIAEPLICNTKKSSKEIDKVVRELLDDVGLPLSSLDRYTNEFSGGQRQRIAIARALALRPRLIICDEPTSALDVSVQAQVLNLLKELQLRHGLSYLFITHNISVVEYIATSLCVMFEGEIVEQGSVATLFSNAQEEYTKELLSSAPRFEQPQTCIA
jgi:oligopeptide/dipeptide ABC transporter ATP-binding protein